MAKYQVLYVRDIKANCVPFTPLYVIHIGSAVRDFGDQCQNPETVLSKHPEDYELYHHGEWDDVDATYTPHKKPIQLAVGSNYRKNDSK